MAQFKIKNGIGFIEFFNTINEDEYTHLNLKTNNEIYEFKKENFSFLNKSPLVFSTNVNPKVIYDLIVIVDTEVIVYNNEKILIQEPLIVDKEFLKNIDSSSFVHKPETIYNKPKKVAAFTHVYNETDMLKLWVNYYGRELDYENLYVIDHSSNIDIKLFLPFKVNVIRLPRGEYDNVNITHFCMYFQRFLLTQYEWVIHTDCDEILVLQDRTLRDMFRSNLSVDYNLQPKKAFNILFDYKNEQPLDINKPISEQRKWMIDAGLSFEKVAITKHPTTWTIGFHNCYDSAIRLNELWLLHLKFIDFDISLNRNKLIWQSLNVSKQNKKYNDIEADVFYNIKTKEDLILENEKFQIPNNCIEIPEWIKI